MSDPIEIARSSSTPAQLTGSRAGAAEVDVTPHLGLPMAGYSVMASAAVGVRGRLRAQAFYLQQDQVNRVAIVLVDHMSCSRILHEMTAAITARECGLSVDRLVVAGTHTHNAPGRFYGNALYDTLAHNPFDVHTLRGLDLDYVNWLATRLATAVTRACSAAKPAKVGFATKTLWGVSRNRSLNAFRQNGPGWDSPGAPGENPPSLPSNEYESIDPRVRALVAQGDDGSLIGAMLTFGCHATACGFETDVMNGDWPAETRRLLDREFRSGGVFSIGISGAGDATAFDPDQRKNNWSNVQKVAQQVASAGTAAIGLALHNLEPIRLQTAFSERSVAGLDKQVGGDPRTLLAREFYFGLPVLGGSEESRGAPSCIASEGDKDPAWFATSDPPQVPKIPAFGSIQGKLKKWLRLAPSPVWPVHSINLNGHVIATVPGEPTSWAAWEIEKAVKGIAGLGSATVLGWAGDYSGYFATAPEYDAQHYEGASTLWGRNSVAFLAQLHKLLVTGQGASPFKPGKVVFDIPQISGFGEETPWVNGDALEKWTIKLVNGNLVVGWEMPMDARIIPGDEPFLEVVDGMGNPVVDASGVPLNDVTQAFNLRRVRQSTGVGPDCYWNVEFPRTTSQGQVFLRANRRGKFPGFVWKLP